MRIPLVGGSAQVASPKADGQVTINLFQEPVESGQGKAPVTLYKVPGLLNWSTGLDAFPRGLFEQNGRCYAASGSTAYELGRSGDLLTTFGALINDTLPVTFSANGTAGNQIFLTSGGYGEIINTVANTMTRITDVDFPSGSVSMGAFLDLYFLALKRDTRQVNYSDLGDGSAWGTLDLLTKTSTADNLRAMWVSARKLWLAGREAIEVWYNSGDALNPFVPFGDVIIRPGIAGEWTWALLNDMPVFIGSNRMAYLAEGFSLVHISTHTQETAWADYGDISDAIGFSVQQRGHGWVYFSFPSQGTTWVWDARSDTWFERRTWDADTATWGAFLGRCAASAFNKTLVGDRVNGTIYEQDFETYTDGAYPLRWVRRFWGLDSGRARQFYRELVIAMEAGVGLTSGQGSDPQVVLRWSDDAGKTWSSERWIGIGALGEYDTGFGQGAVFTRLGSGYGRRLWEISGTDPVYTSLLDAHLNPERRIA